MASYTMPGRTVTVKADFVLIDKPCDGGADCPSRAFSGLTRVMAHLPDTTF